MQRQIRKQTAAGAVGTRSQQALQLQREAQKLEKQTRSREQRKKKHAALPAGSRNERKSTGANRWVYVRQYCAKIDEAARNRMELIVPKLAKAVRRDRATESR